MQLQMLIILILSVVISGVSVLYINISHNNLKLLLSFSGSYLFAISTLHLIPEIYISGSSDIGVYVLIGFFIQILLEFSTQGIEHGHIHIHKHNHKHSAFPYTMMIGLSVHSFLEGMPLANLDNSSHRSLLIGIVMHNIPIAIALMTMLIKSNIKTQNAILWLILFALATPLGTFTSYALDANIIGNFASYFDRIMAVVVGIFLHISTTILFESTENHRFNLIKFIVILLGAGAAIMI
jgi:zinc and cadmium transporter